MQIKKQKVTLTELQRYLPFPSPDGKFTFPERIRRYLLSPSFGHLPFKDQNAMKDKYEICYRNYFPAEVIVDHLDKLTKGKYYRHSLQMAVKNAAQKYGLIDWYKFYRTVKLNKLQNIFKQQTQHSGDNNPSSNESLQQRQKAAKLIQKVYSQFKYRKRVKKGREQVEDIKRTLQQRLIKQFGKQVIKQVKEFYQNKNGSLVSVVEMFEKQLVHEKVTFIELERLLNGMFEMYMERKKIIYLYLHFDHENKGHFGFSHFKQVIFEIRKEKKFVAQTEYLSSIDKVMNSIRVDMKAAFYSVFDMITEFTQNYLHFSRQQSNFPNKDDELEFQQLYNFISQKGQHKYSKYQISKVLERVKFFGNLQYLFDPPKYDELCKAIIKMTEKKQRKKQLHSQNEVFYSYRKILFYIVSRCKAQKLTKQTFAQFIVSHDPTLKYNSFFSVFRVYGNLINIKRIKSQSQLNSFACLLRTLKTDSQYEKLYDEFLENYHDEFELPYSSILDKVNVRLDFLLENHNIQPLPQMHPHDIVNYQKTIKLLFQPDLDLVARSYIHRKVASKFVALYRRIKHNKHVAATINAMNILGKALKDDRKKSSKKKDTIESNDSKSKRNSKRMSTQKSAVVSCKSKKSQPSQRKYKPQDLQLMKDLLFDLIDNFNQDKNDSIRKRLNSINDSKSDYVTKFKVVSVKKDKISFRSSLVNCFAYHELIGLLIYGNNNELMCFRNQQLDKIQIKLLYKPNISVLGLEIFQNFIVILTSYFTLEFYKLHQSSKYPFKTLKVGENVAQKLGNNEIQKLAKDCQFGAYPRLLKCLSSQILGVNMSFIDESIWIMRRGRSKESQEQIFPIKICKREHYFNQSIQKLIRVMAKRLQKNSIEEKIRLINQVIDFLGSIKEEVLIQETSIEKNDEKLDIFNKIEEKIQDQKTENQNERQKVSQQNQNEKPPENTQKPQNSPLKTLALNLFNIQTAQKNSPQKKDLLTIAALNYKKFLQIVQTTEQNQEGRKSLSEYQWIQIFKFFVLQTQKQFFRVELREQLIQNVKQHFKIKVPEQIRQVTLTVQEYLSQINFSLKDLILKLDQRKQGCIKVKKIKDYFLKITQQTYLIHEKRIDSYLKKLAISKHISYDSFVSIFTEWNFKIWEKPRQVVRDFFVVEKFSLLIYTLDSDCRIFLRTLGNESRIVAILEGHQSVPSITLADDQMILISGDSSKVQFSTVDLHLWRLNEDVILKLCSQKVFKGNFQLQLVVKPFYTKESIHDDGISSISYLSRSHCLVTSSLDSTMKIHLINSNPFILQQTQRIYFHDCYFLSLVAKSFEIQNDILIESLVSLRIKKHINQKNINKYEVTCEVYDIEKVAAKVPVKNQFINLPIKLTSMMENHAFACLKKKEKHHAKKIQKLMQAFISTDFLQQSLEANFFSALKKYFIFNEPNGLINLLKYIQKKDGSHAIMESILLKYGLKIVDKNLFPINVSEKSMMQNYELTENEDQNLSQVQKDIKKGHVKIFMVQEELNQIQAALEKLSNKGTGLILTSKLKEIGQIFLFGKQLQIFNLIVQYETKRIRSRIEDKQKMNEKMNTYLSLISNSKLMNSSIMSMNEQNESIIQLNPKDILKYFTVKEVKKSVQRLYKYLREMAVLLKKKKTPIWRLFSTLQQNVPKQRFIFANNFVNELKSVGFQEDKAELISWYLVENGKISIFQLINYVQIAFKEQQATQKQSQHMNFSQLLHSNIIESESKRLEIVNQYNNSKLKQNIENRFKVNSSIRTNSRFQKTKLEKNDSGISQKKSEDSSLKSSKKSSKKQSPKITNKGRRNLQRSQSGSRALSPSNSLGTLTREISHSNTKDSKKRQVYQIRHKLNNLLTNEKKTLWQLVSSAVPEFLEEAVITEIQYFDLFKLMKSTLKLSEKLALLNYLKNQHPQRVIDLNDLFELLEDSNKTYVHGEKYIIQYFVNKLISSEQNLTVEQALEVYFFEEPEDELTLEEVIQRCCQQPFKFNHFALRQFEDLLFRQSKSNFIKEDIIDLIDKVYAKYELKIQNKNLTIMEEILFKIDKKKIPFEELFPKIDMVTETYFVSCINNLSKNYSKKAILKDFESIKLNYKKTLRKKNQNAITSNTKRTGKSTVSKILEVPYAKFKTQLNNILEDTRESTDKERQSSRKLIRYLQSKRISVFNFFISLDLQKKFFINEIQFETGLIEIGIRHSFWHAINKKFENRLYYYEFIRYLVDANVLDIKYVDSELEIAMEKLIKKVIRTTDLEEFYQKLIDNDANAQVKQVTFKSFNHYFVQNYSVFSQKQIIYLFSTFANSQHIKNSKFSNDEIIKNEQNIQKTFNFQMFVDVVHLYKMQTLTKTPQFKFIDYLKKRSISLLHEFYKFMEKNKKNKEIAQALKKKSTILSKELILTFLNEIKAGLSEKEIKEMLSSYTQLQIDFTVINQKLEQIYKKSSNFIGREEAEVYLGDILKKSKEQNVAIQRLFSDFCQDKNNKLTLKDFMNMSDFLNTGLNKIQLKKVFITLLDEQNKGFCFLSQMMNAIENVEEKIDKDEEDFQFDFILEKIETNRKDINLRESQIVFSLEKCIFVFSKVLTKAESTQLYNKAGESVKKQKQLTEKDIHIFIDQKTNEKRMKADKKYKELVLTLLSTIKKSNIDITEVYKYFTMGSKNSEVLAKDRFLLLYQSVILKSNIIDVNNLYAYFDENKTGNISILKWEEKLGIIDMENENVHGSVEELKVFYKVKVFLAELYLMFVQKQFKTSQIYHYFDKHATGMLKYNEFWSLIYELGFEPSDEIQRKVVNYLDRTKSKIIEIRILMSELQNCLGKKQKIVLQTKTSFIFKKNADIIQTKYSYFINQLIRHQELVQKVLQDNEVHQQSCIMQSDFLTILKRFGIYLTEEELSDLRRNFKSKENYLYLYPLYFMLRNIFEETSSFEEKQKSEKLLFKKLLCEMIRNKITLREIERIKGHEEMRSFMKQLKLFTPIQIDIILQSISFDESSVINPEKLKVKIRDSYVDHPVINQNTLLAKSNYGQTSFNNAEQSLNAIAEDDYLNETLRDHLRSLLKFQNHIALLQNYSKNIYEQDFKEILQKLGCRIKVKDMKKYFKAFAQSKRFIKSEHLIFQNTLKNTKSNHQTEDQTHHDINLLIQHIQKSLHYTNKKFRKALEKYFVENYGFITVENFKRFLKQIGYEEGQKENYVVQKFICYYEKKYHQIDEGKKCKQLQITKLQDILSTEEDQNENSIEQHQPLTEKIQTKTQTIFSPEIKNIIIDLKVNSLKLVEYLKKHDIMQSFSVEVLYRFITEDLVSQQMTHRQRRSYEKAARLFCTQLNKTEITFDELQTKINHLIKFHYMYSQTEHNQINLEVDKIHSDSILEKVLKTNIIEIFLHEVNNFVLHVSKTSIGGENIDRLTLNLLFEQIQGSRHLLKIDSKFQRQYQRKTGEKIQINLKFDEIGVSLITNMDLVIETERYLEEKALTVINEKYYAIPVNRRDQFQAFAKIAFHLNPSCKFIRAKGYFLWEPNRNILPKCSIRYRWKFIKNFTSNLLAQFAKIHKLGYCCPHLQYEDLNQNISAVIDKAIYPWKIDSNGKVIETVHSELFDVNSAYSVPEIIRNQKGLITSKCDAWTFGCLLYEFIWGHEPQSFFNELLRFNKARQMGEDIYETLKIEEYPVEFAYKFYDTAKILKVYEEEFYFDDTNVHRDLQTSIKKWQSFKGLIYPLQIVFGKYFVFYQEEFNAIAEIHQIISECLDPNPITRPSIEDLLKRPLFEKMDDFDLMPYIETIQRHINTSELQHEIFSKIDELQKEIESNGSYIEGLERIIQRVYEFLNETQNLQSKVQLIDKIFTIPKNFPQPKKNPSELSQQQFPYSYNLSKNKDLILQNPLLNTICMIFKKRMIPKTIKIFNSVSDHVNRNNQLTSGPKNNELKQLEKCQLKLQNLLFNALQLTKNYRSPASGFVEDIIGYVMQYISENSRLTLKIEQRVRDFSVLAQQSGQLNVQQDTTQFSLSCYFKLPTINSHKVNFIKKLQNIIFINGQGNAQYTVLNDYLTEHQNSRTIIEVFYSSMDLMILTNKCQLAINYFRDRIYLIEEMPDLMIELRVELLVMRNLSEKSLKENCLRYFVELVGNNFGVLPKLFYCQLFYVNLVVMLRSSLETVDVKNTILEIIIKLLQRDEQQIIEIMTSPSCNMFPFIVRLLIEPEPELAAHQQFELLQQKLGQLVHVIESSFTLMEMFQQIQGGLYALRHFRGQEHLNISSKIMN